MLNIRRPRPRWTLLALLLAAGCPGEEIAGDDGACREPFETTVTRVIDGDTFEVDPPVPMPSGVQSTDVRPLCLDTPEVGECHFDEATEALRSLILGETVLLTFGDECTDGWDRALAYVWLGDLLVNVEMARTGHGGLIHPPYDDKPYCDEVKQAMQEASADGLGGWATCSGYPFEL